MNSEFSDIQNCLCYKFKNINLLEEALTHPSINSGVNYERLEFLGDSVLGLVVAHKLFVTFPEDCEGFLSKKQNSLVMKSYLVDIANKINLSNYVYISEGEKKNGVHKSRSTLENVLEAIIGALYIDGGMNVVFSFISAYWDGLISEMHVPPSEPKTELQEWSQKYLNGIIPKYRIIEKIGPDHSPTFHVSVSVVGYESYGSGKTKRLAEQSAAAELLNIISEGEKK